MPKFWKYFLFGFAGAVAFFLLMSVGLFGYMPSVEDLQDPNSAWTEVISVDGK